MAALGPALVAACLLGAPAGAQAQETVVIGGGPAVAPLGTGGVVSGVVGSFGNAGSGIVINDSVLDSLGPGTPAAGVPLAAPQTPVYGAAAAPFGAQTPGTAPGARSPGVAGAYRLPGSGQLVVTRPSTLLFPPLDQPKSHLAVPPARAAQAKPAPVASGGKLTSRLIAAPPKQPIAEPSAPSAAKTPERVTSEAVPAAPQMAKKAAPAPAMRAAVKPSAPPPPSLAKTIGTEAGAAAARPEPPSISATIAPKPSLPEPSLPEPSTRSAVAAPVPPKPPSVPAPLVAPQVLAPKVAAPARQTPAAPAQPAAVQGAARTTGAAAAPAGGDLSLEFKAGSAELSDAAKAELRGLAKTLGPDGSGRVQLLAFAAEDGEGVSRARRLSLSRALAVRAFLIDQGVPSTRMDVRALGNKAGDGPADRVDVLAQ